MKLIAQAFGPVFAAVWSLAPALKSGRKPTATPAKPTHARVRGAERFGWVSRLPRLPPEARDESTTELLQSRCRSRVSSMRVNVLFCSARGVGRDRTRKVDMSTILVTGASGFIGKAM